jgi:hypothetical protein
MVWTFNANGKRQMAKKDIDSYQVIAEDGNQGNHKRNGFFKP